MKSIIELAREAGIDRERPYLPVEYREPWNSCTDAELARFAHLVRADVLEELASKFDADINYAGIAAAFRTLKEKT